MPLKKYFQQALDNIGEKLSQSTGVGVKKLDELAGYDNLSARRMKKIQSLKPAGNWGAKDINAAIKLGKAKSVIPAGILAGGAAVLANDDTRNAIVSALDRIFSKDKNR